MGQAEVILEIMEKLIECFESLLENSQETILDKFESYKVYYHIEEIESYYNESQFVKKYQNAMAEILSVKASAERVIQLAQGNDEKTFRKLEFELLPLTENLRLNFYYYNWIYSDKEKTKNFFENEVSYYYRNRYMEKAKKDGRYKYQLSILVTGFNKVEVTKLCVESLKKYLPENISYELIFHNHGSSDGTKEYFESQKPDKQVDTEVNGGGITVIDRIMEGKYRLCVSNDVLITRNCIENLYKCISSDEKIGWVVPTTPNVSNLQTIEANYSNMDEMYQFAEKNNISNRDRWEEKPRLCNPADISRVDSWFDVIGKKMMRPTGISFPDDRISYTFRRAGYKQILAKDAYCYHFGSVTIGNEIDNQLKARVTYTKGRINFIKELGIDPWGYGMAYDVSLMERLEIKKTCSGNLLGINSGLGGNLLKIKSLLKENTNNKNAKITYMTEYDMNWEDLKGLGDKAYRTDNWAKNLDILEEKYDYILLENGVNIANINQIENLQNYLTKEGTLFIRVNKIGLVQLLKSLYKAKELVLQQNNFWVQIEGVYR